MLKYITLALLLLALGAALQWEDCANTNASAIKVSQFEAPTHINFPGIVHFTVNLTFTRIITTVYIDFHVTRYFLGFPLRLPCKEIVGTCIDVDMCSVLNRTINYMPYHPDSYGQKLQELMNTTKGHYMKCPIQKENIFAKNVLDLGEIPSYLHLLADGDYTVKVSAKETKQGPIIGCVEVNVTIGGQGEGSASLIG